MSVQWKKSGVILRLSGEGTIPGATQYVLPCATTQAPAYCMPVIIPTHGVYPVATTAVQVCPMCPAGTVTVYATPWATTIVITKKAGQDTTTTATAEATSTSSRVVVIVKNDNEEAADANTNSAPARMSLNYAAILAMALCILPALVL
jgi:hypothetical protein